MLPDPIGTISTGITVLDLADRFLPTFTRTFQRLIKGELKIAIFGAGGTGKSTLGKLLSGEWEEKELLQSYQESVRIEKYRLEGNTIGLVTVVPGQERRQDTWDELFRVITQGEISLVINVVSWGYHSLNLPSYEEYPFYQQGMTVKEFLEKYAEEQRNKELQFLSKIVPHLSIASTKNRKLFLITLVTKQDLWWKNRLQVQDFYQNSEYAKQIQVIQNKLGSANFVHEYCYAALVIENLLSRSGEIILSISEGYDERLKFTSLQAFFKQIESLCEIKLKVKEE